MSVIGKAIQMPRMHSLLVLVRCKRDGAGILKGRGSLIVQCPRADIVDKRILFSVEEGG